MAGSVFSHGGTGDLVVVKSSCDVRALTYCDLKLLHIPGFVEVLWLYPDFKDKFAEDIIHDLTYNLREGYVPEESSDEENIADEDEDGPSGGGLVVGGGLKVGESSSASRLL